MTDDRHQQALRAQDRRMSIRFLAMLSGFCFIAGLMIGLMVAQLTVRESEAARDAKLSRAVRAAASACGTEWVRKMRLDGSKI